MNTYHLLKMQDTKDVIDRTVGSNDFKGRKYIMESLLKSEMGAEAYILDQNGIDREPFRSSLKYYSFHFI